MIENSEPRQRILIVDDERVNRSALAAILKDEHQIILARDGEQALARLADDRSIDLILLDVLMPEMDGFEVLRRIKASEATQDIPVIFITALNSQEDEERGLILGAADYIGKPFNPAIVKARVSNLLRFVRQRKLLEALAGRDGLTEIPNRRSFDQALSQVIVRSQQTGRPFSVALLDVDFFKQYNDRYGHARGDKILKRVAQAITAALPRSIDFAARYGGEEFALLFPDADETVGRTAAEGICAAIEALDIHHDTSCVAPRLTASIGGVSLAGDGVDHDPESLISAADCELYGAKHHGRNRVQWRDMSTEGKGDAELHAPKRRSRGRRHTD